MTHARLKSKILGTVANASIGYNLQSASIAIAIASNVWKKPEWVAFVTLGTTSAGIIVGMLSMGYVGDRFGRRAAMCITTALTCISIFVSAFLSFGSDEVVYIVFSIARFFLGIGIGGTYPLSAVSAAESVGEREDASWQVAKAFFWQAPAQLSPSVIALLLMVVLGGGQHMNEIVFRCVLAVGLLPAAIAFITALRTVDDAKFQARQVRNPIGTLLWDPEQTSKLLVGSLSWFFYDIAFFGITLFTPRIVQAIVCASGPEFCSLQEIIEGSAAMACCALPGMLIGLAFFRSCGCRLLNLVGFLVLTCLFVAFGIAFAVQLPFEKAIKLVLLGLVTSALFSANCIATYVYPAIAFPMEVRASASGMCGMGGKIGALVGSFAYQPLAAAFGEPSVFFVQALLCFGGFVLCAMLQHEPEKQKESPSGRELLQS